VKGEPNDRLRHSLRLARRLAFSRCSLGRGRTTVKHTRGTKWIGPAATAHFEFWFGVSTDGVVGYAVVAYEPTFGSARLDGLLDYIRSAVSGAVGLVRFRASETQRRGGSNATSDSAASASRVSRYGGVPETDGHRGPSSRETPSFVFQGNSGTVFVSLRRIARRLGSASTARWTNAESAAASTSVVSMPMPAATTPASAKPSG
jgi:hypothetical protein